MKSNFLIKRTLSIVLSVVLVVSSLYIGVFSFDTSAASETATQTSVEEKDLFSYDYESATTGYTSYQAWKYRGNSRPAIDPDNGDNIALAHIVEYADWGIVVLGDKYTAIAPSEYIKAEKM